MREYADATDARVNAACSDKRANLFASHRFILRQHVAAALRHERNSASKAWLRALEMTAKIDAAPERIFPVVIEELGARFGDAPALISARENFSHAELAARANRYARWALAQGIAKGDVVALMMPNRADYLAIWLGITRIGGVVALINTNLTGAALAHCVDGGRAQARHRRAGAGRRRCGARDRRDGLAAWRGVFADADHGFSGDALATTKSATSR